ncbi:hypothetical protein [Amycolatopsis sp. H20-H5]|uniref:hypothetical protein n=1 Tax=Amycolatopsis sp. H20-H5 TaxID=3046309 RepID=UPI002DB9C2BA|nr:hypothetical protein [Amycolatopsis sp. H20-H5]MEC3979553.1 hypothetical protein [Amycolatopsis sp. H20-H5]
MQGDRLAVEAWFRRRGLPTVVERGRRGRGVLYRAAPFLAFFTVLDPLLSGLLALLDVPQDAVDVRLDNTGYVIGVLSLTLGALVVPAVGGWLVDKALEHRSERTRLVVAIVFLVLGVVVLPVLEVVTGLGDTLVADIVTYAVLALLVLLFVRVGVGSILGWAVRSAAAQVSSLGTLASRALPLLLLVVMFSFFTGELWQAAERLSRSQLWIVLAFLGVIGALFVLSMLSDELKTLRSGEVQAAPSADLLRATPFAGAELPAERKPLARSERVNIVLVLFLAQLAQIVAFAVLVFVFFVVFGALMIQPEVVTAYAGRASAPGVLFGVRLPVSNALIQVSLFLSVFSGLYFAASTATDVHYRRAFFEPLLDDVARSLAARDIYLAHWADAGSVRTDTLEGKEIPE